MESRKIIIVKSDCYRILAIVKTVLRSVLIVLLLLPLVSLAQQKITWEKDGKEIVLIPVGSFSLQVLSRPLE